MKISELIEAATVRSGQSQLEIAKELQVRQATLSEWKSGQRKPDADEIAYFAEKAGLSVLATVADIQASLNPRYASIWKKAVSELRQNQGLSRWVMTNIKGPFGPLFIGSAKALECAGFHKRAGVLALSF